MAPMYSQDSSPVSTPPATTLFEGAEKKLHMVFTPAGNTVSEVSPPTLRMLSRHQVNEITDAAKCIILSVISNEAIDAYLLSESSLFISSHEVVLKTCGTTTLLHAVPTIIGLAASLGLAPSQLTFTRVAYLFPDEQPYPHNSFENEAGFLDEILHCHGHATRHITSVSSEWYAYTADFNNPSSFENDQSAVVPYPAPFQSKKTLEICMFDLDPAVMSRFTFHKDPTAIGADKIIGGTTDKAGITQLLVGSDAVDAFNFDPCGYSMNAITPSGGYYTIHITPEEECSYVSFEARVENDICPRLISDVVHTFRPGRFTVSLLVAGDSELKEFASVSDDEIDDDYRRDEWSPGYTLPFDWNAVTESLQSKYSSSTSPHIEKLGQPESPALITAVVAAYAQRETSTCEVFEGSPNDKPLNVVWTDVSSDESSGNGIFKENIVHTVNSALEKVREECGALPIIRGFDCDPPDFSTALHSLASDSCNLDGGKTWPILLIDLTRITNNYLNLRKKDIKKNGFWDIDGGGDEGQISDFNFRFTVRSCPDKHVLRLLAHLPDIVFEAGDALEVDALKEIGVCRERIVLATTFVTKRHLCLFEEVSKVIVHGKPNEMVLRAIKSAGVGVEVMMSVASVEEGIELVDYVNTSCGTIVSSIGPEKLHGHDEDENLIYEVRDKILDKFEQAPMVRANGSSKEPNVPSIIEVSERLLSKGACNVVLTVVGVRKRGKEHCDVFLNDGIYGTLAAVSLRGHAKFAKLNVKPRALVGGETPEAEPTIIRTTLWGPTCDATDRIWDGDLPEMEVGQYVVLDNVGAYVLNLASTFNGFATKIDAAYVA